MQELSTTGSPTANLLTGLGVDDRFTRTDSSGTQAFLTDALGSTVALAGSSGAVATSFTYEPFGTDTASGAPSAVPYRFTGRENAGNGLHFMRARYYNPTWGRFIAEDPLGFPGGPDPNLYAYVGNNPIAFADRLGLDPGGCGFLGFECIADFFVSHVRDFIIMFDMLALSLTGLGYFEFAMAAFAFTPLAQALFITGALASLAGATLTATSGSTQDKYVAIATNLLGFAGPRDRPHCRYSSTHL